MNTRRPFPKRAVKVQLATLMLMRLDCVSILTRARIYSLHKYSQRTGCDRVGNQA